MYHNQSDVAFRSIVDAFRMTISIESLLAFYTKTNNLIIVATFIFIQFATWLKSNRTTLLWVTIALLVEILVFSLVNVNAWKLSYSLIMVSCETIPLCLTYLILNRFRTSLEQKIIIYESEKAELSKLKYEQGNLVQQIDDLERNRSIYESLANSYSQDLEGVKVELRSKIISLEEETQEKIKQLQSENESYKTKISNYERRLESFSVGNHERSKVRKPAKRKQALKQRFYVLYPSLEFTDRGLDYASELDEAECALLEKQL